MNVLRSLLNEGEFDVGIPTISPSGSADRVGTDFLEHRAKKSTSWKQVSRLVWWPLTHNLGY